MVKTVHTAIWVIVEGAMIYLLGAGFAGRIDRRVVVAGVVAAEGTLFMANGARCPLTSVAESLGAETGSVTDILLPNWLARNVPGIHVPLIVLTLYLHHKNLRTERRSGQWVAVSRSL